MLEPPRFLLSSMLTLLLLLAARQPLAAQFECEVFRRGDATVSGAVDVADPLLVLFHLFRGRKLPCASAADADDSGDLGVADALWLLRYLFLEGAPPPDPGPFECGADRRNFDELTCVDTSACAPVEDIVDLSGFTTFRYEQLSGFGFCPRLDAVYCAAIQRTDEGYRLEMTLQAAEPGPDAPFCGGVPSSCEAECGTIAYPTPRMLTPAEVERMLELFADVVILHGTDPICSCVAFDPCVIARFHWDDLDVTNYLCGSSYVPSSQGTAIEEFLDSLILAAP